MKKILFGFAVLAITLTSAQNYPDDYPNSNNNSSYNGDYDDSYWFPDDYYYQYPDGYYTSDYYQRYYDDYRRSIADINWNRFFSRYRLAPWQIQQIMMLNDLYPSFSAWDSFYRYNPDRWYYDRFYALERILGPRVFVVFQNSFYGGYSPVVYYQQYRRQHYATNIYIMPRYRNININRYRVDRVQYHQSNPHPQFGFGGGVRNSNNGVVNGNNGGFRSDTNTNNGGFRNNAPQNGGFRNDTNTNTNGGFRNDTNTNNGGFRNTPKVQSPASDAGTKSGGFRNGQSSGGFRSQLTERETSFRNAPAERRVSNNSSSFKSTAKAVQNSPQRFSSR